jgi:DHA3 family macrolide efflux protein-like MFS transporter
MHFATVAFDGFNEPEEGSVRDGFAMIWKAIQDLRIRRLWIGQVGSSVGDELYRMAFIWLAVELLGADTGYAAALQMAAVIVFGVFFGGIGERYRPDRVMVSVDLFRAFLSVVPAVLFLLGKPSYPVLLLVTVMMGALGTYFDPAMQSSILMLLRDPRQLRGANGLMGTTYRLARVIGPALIALLSGWVPVHHFFTINSLTYVFSAISIRSLSAHFPAGHLERPSLRKPWALLLESLQWMRSDHRLFRAYLFKSIVGGIWGAVYLVGFALLAHEFDSSGFSAYAWIMACYGFGNILSALVFGSLERRLPEGWIYGGFLLIGISFFGMANSRSMVELCLFSALGAVGGPMNDLPFLEMMQERFSAAKLTRLVRLRIVSETVFYLFFTLVSPVLFKNVGVKGAISGAGLFCGLLSVSFYLRSRRAQG